MEIRECDIEKTWAMESVLNFTRYFFKKNYHRKFIVGQHHIAIANELDKVLRGETKRLIINLPPRFGKTEIAVKHFIAMGLAVNPKAKFVHLSYSDDLVRDNSQGVQNIVRLDEFQSLFPNTMPQTTNTRKWYTEAGGGLYAVSSAGQVTGFGAGLVELEEGELADEIENVTLAVASARQFGGAIVIDDPIKPDDALSDLLREKVNKKFETTIRNRVNSVNTPIIIIMQRLHERDLCGYLMNLEPDEWRVLSLKAIFTDENGNEQSLWPRQFPLEKLREQRDRNSWVFETQYLQNPKPMEGLMYEKLRTYESLPIIPKNKQIRKNYTDTADTGNDWLCSICYVEYEFGMYVTDVLYTKKPMEYTEPATAKMLVANQTEIAMIESNNGGRGFARNVEQQVRVLGNTKMRFESFHQGINKQERIFAHSAEVQNLIYFPSDWEVRWREFANDVKGYRKEGRNAHDDACFVAGTMVATIFGDKPIETIKKGDYVLTPFGVRKVLESGCTGLKYVIKMFGLTATRNHHVYNNGEFIDIVKCEESYLSKYSLKEQLLWRYKRLLCSMESNTDLWGRESIISVSRKAMQGGKMPKDFIQRFGNFITESKYLKAVVFTIKTVIVLIMTSATWSVYQGSNICLCTLKRIGLKKGTENCTKSILTKQENSQTSGTRAKKAERGTVKMQKSGTLSIKRLFAKIVESIFIRNSKTQCIAVTNAEKGTEQKNLNMSECASNVERSLNTEREKVVCQIENSVAHLAEAHTTTCIEPVYNIKVDKDGCFYANGILVSNCDVLTGMIEYFGKHNEVVSDEEIEADFQ